MNNFFCKGRLIIFLVTCILLMGVLCYRYASLALAPTAQITRKQEGAERGSIVDRTGFPLAVQTSFYHVGVTPKQAVNHKDFAKKMAPVLDMSEEQINQIISSKRSFAYLRKKVDESTYKVIKDTVNQNGFSFVSFEKIPGRIYPNHRLAAQLIGFMGDDGKGLAGIEFSEQDILYPAQIPGSTETKHGNNIFLSIDANLQYKLEQIAVETMEETQAESMMLVAADSHTGEVLSYVSLPAPDLNDYGKESEASKMDRPAMYAYEPGSVFKIFTVGIAYDEHGISPNDIFLCDGVYERKLASGETIKIKCLDKHGWITARDALRFSCNDALGQISDRLGDAQFIERIRELGFGQRTDVELPSEAEGFVNEPGSKKWSARSKQTIAIGQEISVTALQMVQAATAIANDGVPLKLTFIHKITDREGTVTYEHQPEYKERVFAKATADYVLSCMETTARSGTGSRANLTDVSIGVKTGTAQIAEHGGYSTTDFLSNCIAIFPIEDPQIILYIVVVKAKGETYAGRIVAPVIAKAADTIIDHLGMSRGGAASLEHNGRITITSSPEVKIEETIPDFTGFSVKELMPLFERKDINLVINGSGWVTEQQPPAGTPFTENMTIELYLK